MKLSLTICWYMTINHYYMNWDYDKLFNGPRSTLFIKQFRFSVSSCALLHCEIDIKPLMQGIKFQKTSWLLLYINISNIMRSQPVLWEVTTRYKIYYFGRYVTLLSSLFIIKYMYPFHSFGSTFTTVWSKKNSPSI